jgi:hypothetical protein
MATLIDIDRESDSRNCILADSQRELPRNYPVDDWAQFFLSFRDDWYEGKSWRAGEDEASRGSRLVCNPSKTNCDMEDIPIRPSGCNAGTQSSRVTEMECLSNHHSILSRVCPVVAQVITFNLAALPPTSHTNIYGAHPSCTLDCIIPPQRGISFAIQV